MTPKPPYDPVITHSTDSTEGSYEGSGSGDHGYYKGDGSNISIDLHIPINWLGGYLSSALMALLILSYSGARFLLPTSAGKMRLPSLYNCTILYCDNRFCSPVHVPRPGLIEDIVAKDVGDFPKLAGNHPPHL